MHKQVTFIRQEIAGFHTADLIQPERTFGPDTGEAVRLDEGRQVCTQLRITCGLRRRKGHEGILVSHSRKNFRTGREFRPNDTAPLSRGGKPLIQH